jgi:hypothetical protein
VSENKLVPVFVPALIESLIAAEDKKGAPLTEDEVIEIRNNADTMVILAADAKRLAESRGNDVDPQNCWQDWQRLRNKLGRKP